MRRFLSQGTDHQGERRWRICVALDEPGLRAQLRGEGILLQTYWRLPRWVDALVATADRTLSARELAKLLRELATLISAGIPIVQGLEMIANDQRRSATRAVIERIRSNVASGMTLSGALEREPRHFDPLVASLVRAGEQSSMLATLLERIADDREQADTLRRRLWRAMLYPLVVIAVALVVTIGMLTFVIPRFEAMFAEFDADLPAVTVAVMQASEQLRALGWPGLCAAILCTALAILAPNHSQWVRRQYDAAWLRLPIFGALLVHVQLAQFTRTLGIMTRAGIPLTEALPAIARTLPNYHYRQAIMRIVEAIRDGRSLSLAISMANRFPDRLIQMVAVGEEAGQLEAMLMRIARQEEQWVEETIEGLSGALEPLIMAVLGVVIGGLVLAMYLPVFQLGSAV